MNQENDLALAPIFEMPRRARHAEPKPDWGIKFFLRDLASRLIQRHGIGLLCVAFLAIWTASTCAIAAHNAKVKTTEELTARYESEYGQKIQQFYDEQEAAKVAENEALMSARAQMEREADALARLIGTMNTKRMKQTMIWNVLVRVDNPSYPGSVEEVIGQPKQWMFYDESNPIREDDRQLALEQLKIWHDGRYPAGLDKAFVFGEWSENDYVLRNTWDKSSSTLYWRMPE